jgi:YbbR domain-containing protein
MWRILVQNFWFKLAAVVMALLLWFHVATDKVYEYSDRFPLEVLNVPERLLLAEKLPEQVNVTIQGKGKELLKLISAERKSLKIDISDFERGETDYLIRPEEIPIPEGLELKVTNILPPKTLKIKLDYPMERSLKVRPDIRVVPAEGFRQVGGVEYDPQEVLVSGPRMWVRNLAEIHTQEKVIQDAGLPISGQVDLVVPEGYNLALSQQEINYSVNVERVVERRFTDLPVERTSLPSRMQIELHPDSVGVILRGTESLMDRIDPDSIRVTVDCSNASRKDTVKLPLLVRLPAEVELIKVEPDSVECFPK